MINQNLIYSTEFKAEVVKKIADSNDKLSETARQLRIVMQTLSKKFDYRRPSESWVSNITYIWRNKDWL